MFNGFVRLVGVLFRVFLLLVAAIVGIVWWWCVQYAILKVSTYYAIWKEIERVTKRLHRLCSFIRLHFFLCVCVCVPIYLCICRQIHSDVTICFVLCIPSSFLRSPFLTVKKKTFLGLCFMVFLFVCPYFILFFLLFCRMSMKKKTGFFRVCVSKKWNHKNQTWFLFRFCSLDFVPLFDQMKRHRLGKIIPRRNRLNFIYCPIEYSVYSGWTFSWNLLSFDFFCYVLLLLLWTSCLSVSMANNVSFHLPQWFAIHL